jgi:hypothetical protein
VGGVASGVVTASGGLLMMGHAGAA